MEVSNDHEYNTIADVELSHFEWNIEDMLKRLSCEMPI